jgi:hypothetical protein
VCPGVRPSFGTRVQISHSLARKLSIDIWFVFIIRHSLWRENRSVIYSCYWVSPVQSFSGLSPVELIIVPYTLNSETQVKFKVILLPTVSRPVCSDIRQLSENWVQYFFHFHCNYFETFVVSFLWGTIYEERTNPQRKENVKLSSLKALETQVSTGLLDVLYARTPQKTLFTRASVAVTETSTVALILANDL